MNKNGKNNLMNPADHLLTDGLTQPLLERSENDDIFGNENCCFQCYRIGR